jgi:hypothetical protein
MVAIIDRPYGLPIAAPACNNAWVMPSTQCWYGEPTRCYSPVANELGLCERHLRELRA